jgi:U32 family peptidase
MNKNKSKPELVVGAGGWESLQAAIEAGADSVYFGLKQFNLRINARSFELNELAKVVARCHEKKVKAFLTLNSIFYDSEMAKLDTIVHAARVAGIDAVICWDFAVIDALQRAGIPIHISTQASISNYAALKRYHDLGARRIVLARECQLSMITELIRKVSDEKMSVEIEAFIHGAMCISVSGRCFISEYLFNRSANRGDCLQPCRRHYEIKDSEEGTRLHVGDGYVLSPKDLCTIGIIDRLIDAGIHSFKIEGRTRPPEYIYTTVAMYRRAINIYCKTGILGEDIKNDCMDQLHKVYNRGFSYGFYMGRPQDDLSGVNGSVAREQKMYIGIVTHFFQKIDVAEIDLKNGALSCGDTLLITGKTTGAKRFVLEQMELDHKHIQCAEKGMRVAIKLDFRVRKSDKVFLLQER